MVASEMCNWLAEPFFVATVKKVNYLEQVISVDFAH